MSVSEQRIKDSLLLVGAWLFAIAYTATNVFPDPDLWGRLAMGAVLFQNRHFPYHDLFSYTAPHALWVDHEWLTGVAFYQILTQFGEAGFMVFKYLMMLGIFALLFRLHRKAYRISALYAFYALILVVDAYSVGLYATVRSHIFSFLFFFIELYLLERVRLGQKSRQCLWLLLPLGVIWGNLHGGYAMGILLLGCYGLGEAIQHRNLRSGLFHWMLAGLSFLLLGFLNPYGPAYWAFLLHAWTLDRSKIGEWSPLRFDVWLFVPAQLLFLLGTLMPLLRWQFRNHEDTQTFNRLLTPTLVLFWTIIMMLRAVRMQPFVAFVAVAYLPLFLDPVFMQRILPLRIKNFFQQQASAFCNTLPALVMVLSLGMVIYMHNSVNLLKANLFDEMGRGEAIVTRYPLGAVDYLKHSPYHGNLLVHFGLGEFVLWRLYPQFKVSMDGRYEEVYDQATFLQNHKCYNKRNWLENQASLPFINQGQADFLLMQTELPVNSLLIRSPLWQVLYADGYFTVLGRKSSLKAFPAYKPVSPTLSAKSISIGDMVTDADLKRFKTSEY
jgi:hypothetical protein